MRRDRIVNGLLLVPAVLVVLVESLLARPLMRLVGRLQRVGPLQRWQRRLAKLPPGAALPLFLVPEAASRAGWVASAWLLMQGAAWEALCVYVLTKLLATMTALWVYRACEPALLRVRWFARLHAAGLQLRRTLFRPSPRFTALRQRVRLNTLG